MTTVAKRIGAAVLSAATVLSLGSVALADVSGLQIDGQSTQVGRIVFKTVTLDASNVLVDLSFNCTVGDKGSINVGLVQGVARTVVAGRNEPYAFTCENPADSAATTATVQYQAVVAPLYGKSFQAGDALAAVTVKYVTAAAPTRSRVQLLGQAVKVN